MCDLFHISNIFSGNDTIWLSSQEDKLGYCVTSYINRSCENVRIANPRLKRRRKKKNRAILRCISVGRGSGLSSLIHTCNTAAVPGATRPNHVGMPLDAKRYITAIYFYKWHPIPWSCHITLPSYTWQGALFFLFIFWQEERIFWALSHCKKTASSINIQCILEKLKKTKSLFPKGTKSIFVQNRVIHITTFFSLPPTFRTHFWSEYKEQKEDNVNSKCFSFP